MVFKCYICNYYDTKKSLYRIPNRKEKYSERWRLWLKLIDEKEENMHKIRICSDHFLSKQPAKNDDYLNIDWVPTQNLGRFSKNKKIVEYRLKTYKNFNNTVDLSDVRKRNIDDLQVQLSAESGPDSIDQGSPNKQVLQILEKKSLNLQSLLPLPAKKRKIEKIEEKFFFPMQVQTEITSEDINFLFQYYQESVEERNKLLLRISTLVIDYEFFKDNDKKVLFYTGLPTWKLLDRLFKLVYRFLPEHGNCKLSPFQMLVLTLIKLRLNLTFTDLAYRFEIDITTASRYFYRCIAILSKIFLGSKLVFWPTDRQNLLNNTPSYFRSQFKESITIIIDCFEICVQLSSVLLAAAQAWSQYKHHPTLKYLIGISTTGAILFVSKGYGGRTSDKAITNRSGFLDRIQEGDFVLADKGFLIENEIAKKKASLRIPCFVKNGGQLHPNEVEQTRQTANVRIHVERVIRQLRGKFNMCSDIARMTTVSKQNDLFDKDLYDKIVFVCCCLVNMCPSVVPNDFEC